MKTDHNNLFSPLSWVNCSQKMACTSTRVIYGPSEHKYDIYMRGHSTRVNPLPWNDYVQPWVASFPIKAFMSVWRITVIIRCECHLFMDGSIFPAIILKGTIYDIHWSIRVFIGFAFWVQLKVLWSTWRKMHEFSKMVSQTNIHTSAYLTASKYDRLPIQIKGKLKLQELLSLPLDSMGNCNFLQ